MFHLGINLSTHFATSSRRRKRNSKIRGLNNTSSLTMALLTSNEGVTGQDFYIRAHLEMMWLHHGDFFLRGSDILTTHEHQHVFFTSAETFWWLMDDFLLGFGGTKKVTSCCLKPSRQGKRWTGLPTQHKVQAMLRKTWRDASLDNPWMFEMVLKYIMQ